MKNRKGFTLVELVIVIAVIAILAAVLIPTFGGIIEKASENAAMQEARNAYTLYLTEATEKEDVVEANLWVKTSKGDWVQIKDGIAAKTAKCTESCTHETEGKCLTDDSYRVDATHVPSDAKKLTKNAAGKWECN